MSDLGNREVMAANIKYFMTLHGKTRKQICEDLGFAYSTFSDWVNGKKYPRIDKIEMMANYFNISKADLVERKQKIELTETVDNIYKLGKIKLPFLGKVACGEPIFADEDRESYIMVGTDIGADFCLQCQGDSMINARIHDGDIVFVKKTDIVENGEIAVVIIDDEATLKRFFYYRDQNLVILKPENPKYQDIILTGDQLNQVRVIGRAVAFQSDVI